ncbi:hypothetical protein B0H14DRAFT_2618632 [Mycena olivaceomarginata]|nr:hypothetical protein B0H14DRAFT_2618632 [Mycena olivaceomarginata]
MSHKNTMGEGVVADSNFGTTVQMEYLVPAAEYEEQVNELEYAGPIYEPDSFGVPMEYPPNLNAGPVDFSSDVLVNSIESATGLDNFTTWGISFQTLTLRSSSRPAPVVMEGMQSTWKCKMREPEVDVRDIIPEGQGCARFRARVRAEGLE